MTRPRLQDFKAYIGDAFDLRLPEDDASVDSLILTELVEHPPLPFGPHKGADCFTLILSTNGNHAQGPYRLVRSDQKEFALFCIPTMTEDMKPALRVIIN